MRRRKFLTLIGGAAAWPLAVRAQSLRRVGFLSPGLPNDAFGKAISDAFADQLAGLGWKDGINLHIDWRWYGADPAQAERHAAELITAKPDLLLASGNPAVEKMRQQTKSIPIVFALVSDPAGMGYVATLAHPGGNITGFMSYDPPIYTKQMQMLTEITPAAKTIAVMYDPDTATFATQMVRAMNDAAKSIGIALRDAPCHNDTDIEAAIAALAQVGNGGLLTLGDIFNQVHRDTIAALALKYQVPTMVNTRQMLESGGLFAYIIDIPSLFSHAATYVDRILKGEKPADLPVQAPTKFALMINLKTAKALGVTIAPALLNNADEVIE